MLPAADVLRHRFGRMALGHPHQHRIDVVVAGLRGIDRIQQARHAGAVERGIGGGAGALADDGVVVLEKLRFLGILERNEHHRVAAGGHHAPGQADHGVIVAADADAVAQCEAGFHVGHRLVMAAGDAPARHQIARLARLAGLEAHHHGAHVGVAFAHLHGEIGDIGGLRHAGHAENAAIDIVANAGRFGIGALGILLHHPQIGAAVVEQHLGVVHHAAIDARHGERHADQQAQAPDR